MLQLDKYLKEIELRHEDEIVRDSYAIPKTIGDKIAM